MSHSTASKAFAQSKRLTVSRPIPHLRVATHESFQNWLAYQREKYDLKKGLMLPDDAKHVHPRTAQRLYDKSLSAIIASSEEDEWCDLGDFVDVESIDVTLITDNRELSDEEI